MKISPKQEFLLERLLLLDELSSFDPSRHLKEREAQYVDVKTATPGGIMVIKETPEGWWKESYNAKGDVTKQLQKLKDDPTIACGWLTTSRFNGSGWDLD